MKILFVENRYRTRFWEEISKELRKQGHTIFWIVQNHQFKPQDQNVYVLDYYKNQSISNKVYSSGLKKIIQGDRGLNYFGVKNDNYIFFYKKQIEHILDQIVPDLIVGECTLFHEKLIINWAKINKIIYLHPSSCRYPSKRFSFYKYDTLVPFKGSNETLSKLDSTEIVENISSRSDKPDYIKNIGVKNPYALSKIEKIKDKLNLIYAYYTGEKFNTPSPFRKIKLNKQRDNTVSLWDNMAETKIANKGKFVILYALQMQPEANIDVWGYPNNNQLEVVRAIKEQLSENQILYVKPNPKSKYEMNFDLYSYVINNSKQIKALKHDVKMDDIFNQIDLVVTVTGTVSIECVMSNKPVVMLGNQLHSTLKNCYMLQNWKELKTVVNNIENEVFPKLNQNEKAEYINELMKTSYSGILGDGLHNRQYLYDKNNFEQILNAFKLIICEIH